MADDPQQSQAQPSQTAAVLANISPEVRAYLEGILIEGGLTDVAQDLMDEMVAQLYSRFDKFLIGKIVEYLPEDKLQEFTKLLESTPTAEAVRDYLTKNISNAQDIFIVAFAQFRDLYLQGAQNADTAVVQGAVEESPGNQHRQK